jgi:hypothetical protein
MIRNIIFGRVTEKVMNDTIEQSNKRSNGLSYAVTRLLNDLTPATVRHNKDGFDRSV